LSKFFVIFEFQFFLKVIETMTSVSKGLSNDVGTFKKKRSLTPDVLKGRSVSVSESLEMQVS
jgi:hypothetical protein